MGELLRWPGAAGNVPGALIEPLGQVEDIAMDVPSGRVAYVIVKAGDASVPQDTRYVVPPSLVTVDSAKRTAMLNSDQAHFTRMFRSAFGVTPGHYARLHSAEAGVKDRSA